MKIKAGDEVRVLRDPQGVTRGSTVGNICKVINAHKSDTDNSYYLLSNGYWYREGRIEKIVDHDVLMQKVLERNNKPDTDDLINSPSHYTRGDIEVIDMIKVIVQGYDPFEAYLVGNTIKYLARANFKENKQQDLEKSQWHINKLLEEQNK